MLRLRIKAVYIFPILLNIFCEILEVGKTKAKKKQIHYQKMTFKSNYYLGMMEVQKEAQVSANESLTFRMKSNEKKC